MLVNTQGSSMKAVSSWACQVALFTLCCASVTPLPCNTGWTNSAISLAELHHMPLGGPSSLFGMITPHSCYTQRPCAMFCQNMEKCLRQCKDGLVAGHEANTAG